MKLLKLLPILCVLFFCSCKDNDVDVNKVFNGQLSQYRISKIKGFFESREKTLYQYGVSLVDFKAWSVDSAWSMPKNNQTSLKSVRESIERPTVSTILQKVIPLEDISVYMNNIYGGTIGGFVAVSADVKSLVNMSDVFWGMRLDYEDTKFKHNGAGYAVIRFYSNAISTLTIPFCQEMGGTQKHAWPNTGGGFTASTLGDGGYPEYVFVGYSAPREGAELYEVTPLGKEILRSVYSTSKGWQTNEIGATSSTKSLDGKIRNGVFSDTKSGNVFITTYCEYRGNRYIVRGEIESEYHITTTVRYDEIDLNVVDKGIYGINVPVSDISRIWEDSVKL